MTGVIARAAAILDVTGATRPAPPAVWQAAWIAAKQARGQTLRMDRLQPAHLVAVTAAQDSTAGGTVDLIDAARGRVAAKIRGWIAPEDPKGAA